MLEPFGFDPYLLAMFTHQLPDYKWFFFIITQLGSPFTLAVLAALGFMLGKGKTKVFSAILVIGILFSVVIVDDIKELAQRPRPDGAKAADFTIKDSYSFPSGHALSIFLAATILGAYFGWRFYAAGYFLAFAVSLSRLYLGVHYPSDIVAGAIIGILMGEMLVYAAYRLGLSQSRGLLSLFKKFRTPAAPLMVKGPDKVVSSSIFLAIVISVGLYFTNYEPVSIFILTVASIFIFFYLLWSNTGCDQRLLMIFAIMSLCVVASITLMFMGSYIVSLVTVLVAYIAVLAMTFAPKKAPGIDGSSP